MTDAAAGLEVAAAAMFPGSCLEAKFDCDKVLRVRRGDGLHTWSTGKAAEHVIDSKPCATAVLPLP